MVQTRRERAQQATREEITETARRQMARDGAAALSLRAIAAEMGLTAPALYRYYASRDELITALIVTTFDAIGTALDTAAAGYAANDYAGQYTAMMHAYRAWALAHRADFTLVYGTPLSGYHAPPEVTVPAVRRSTAPLLALLVRAWRAGGMTAPLGEPLPTALSEFYVTFAAEQLDTAIPPELLHAAIGGWAHLQGLIMLDVFGHLSPAVGDPAAFYGVAVRAELARLGFQSPE